VASHFQTESRLDLYIALSKVPSDVGSDIERMLALNDPGFTHFQRVHTYTLTTCGIDLPGLQP
jgi:hypothetical protein